MSQPNQHLRFFGAILLTAAIAFGCGVWATAAFFDHHVKAELEKK